MCLLVPIRTCHSDQGEAAWRNLRIWVRGAVESVRRSFDSLCSLRMTWVRVAGWCNVMSSRPERSGAEESAQLVWCKCRIGAKILRLALLAQDDNEGALRMTNEGALRMTTRGVAG